jgi:hypothetical protein
VSDAVAKSGTTPLAPAITFILEKAAPFIPKEAAEPEAATEAEATPREVPVAVEEKEEEAAAPSEEKEEAAAPSEEKKEAEKPAEAAAAAPAAEEKK